MYSAGFAHHEMFFEDGSTPPVKIVDSFLHLMSEAKGMVAVHCRAGLGRTGTLAALYIMKRYGWSARQAMGWLRICRPGSVIGQQQEYLERCEEKG
jgi:cell division cycle 14